MRKKEERNSSVSEDTVKSYKKIKKGKMKWNEIKLNEIKEDRIK